VGRYGGGGGGEHRLPNNCKNAVLNSRASKEVVSVASE